ncbi:serine hydrolase domain-containing protein [Pseudonocardia asaccharolytica]|uniref:D-Ala-D-Ala carboxypeptidase n=1 Tax=Pseudonocardia asaccharolytica DSM 44247 = NBRC 16224 TaxID=1123024 RepID=A0A511CUZ3_9PSEU|nr:serine hydrolase domain-containing protein [Pseudonocardia asaccharolytica]GEL16395.1 D-Ala-D-Ala carboxypeptidase [Pseudonocardia asaccharolytica DSM 44247 = NBRC 16224]
MNNSQQLRASAGRRRHMAAMVATTALALVAVLVIAGCSANSSPASTGSAEAGATPSGSSPLKTINPAALQAAVDAAAKEMMIPGAVVEVRTPQGDFTAAVGTTELGAEVPPGGDTHFRIASITKTMTAAVIVLQAQEGKLRFSDPISKYVPDVPNGENITIAELLRMRSGLYGYTNDPEFAATLDADPAKVWTPQEVLAIAFRHPPEFPPGTDYDYSNTNYALLGLVAEKVDGKPLAQAFQDRLYGPLGIKQSVLPASTDTSIPDPYSHGYMYGGSAFALVDTPYPPDMESAAKAGTLQPIDYTNQNSSYATGAGGAISTADDLATWIRALVDGQVFNADFQRQWLEGPQPTNPAEPKAPYYGYGIERQSFAPDVTMYYHFGELPGFNSFSGYDPVNKVTIVLWSNLTVSPDSRPTANALLLEVVNQVYTLPS